MAAKGRSHGGAPRPLAHLCLWARLLVAAIAVGTIPAVAHASILAVASAPENSPLGLATNPAPALVGAEQYQALKTPLESAFGYGQLASDSAYATRGTGTALQTFYPAANGFLGATRREFLYAGTRIDRYGGSAASRFFSPAGTPAAGRALPPGTTSQPLRTFEVVKPFEVEAGTVAPAFNQLGLGTQFRTPLPLETLLRRGILREVTP